MSSTQRVYLGVGALIAALLSFVVMQGLTQEAKTQTEGEAGDPTYQEGAQQAFASGEIIVKLEEDASQEDLRDLNRRTDASVEEDLPQSEVSVVDLPQDLSVSEAVSAYEASPQIEYAEPNFLLKPAAVPNDPSFSMMYALNNTGQTGGVKDADIDAPKAWDTTTGSDDVVVAVIDEGVDISHPDLRDKIWTNAAEVAGNGVDDDGNGYVDDVNGWDFVNDDASVYDPDPLTGTGDEHGTHVAGTIAAAGDNGTGITGVSWRTRIMPLKFLGVDGGYTSDAIEAINYAVDKGVKISNNSWGGGGKSQALQDAIARADSSGHLFVAAAGNGGADGVGDDNDAAPHYPSSYSNPNIVAVAATDDRDTLASFSNFGVTSVDLAAPGVRVLSTLPGDAYGSYSGTSMATPHVTGVAALVKSRNLTLGDAKIKAKLLKRVDEKAGLAGKVLAGGRLNAARAVAVSTRTPAKSPDITDPTIGSLRPVPGSKVRDRTPVVAATVRDDRTDLAKSDIRLYVDGSRKGTFTYDTDTDRLRFTSGRLAYGRHAARIVATDAAGNTGANPWAFRIVKPG
ncbi:MAG: S8 family serine peptidase [Actinomycetota bacterium]|nr:S8 family serine peptidase [Actinomycetota bacterium]